jgi:hypothetical protein
VKEKNNMRRQFLTILLASVAFTCFAQDSLHTDHANLLARTQHFTKEEIINEVPFVGVNSSAPPDVVRFDAWELSTSLPLILSTHDQENSDVRKVKYSVLTSQALTQILDVIDHDNTGRVDPVSKDGFCFRITYRKNGVIKQYFIGSKEAATYTFEKVRQFLVHNRQSLAVELFRDFVTDGRLVESSAAGTKWKYAEMTPVIDPDELSRSPKITKEQVIDEVPFVDAEGAATLDILRLDALGTFSGFPVVISSRAQLYAKSRWVETAVLSPDSLSALLQAIEQLNTKLSHRTTKGRFCFRVTYRFNSQVRQYFIDTEESAVRIFKVVERRLQNFGDKQALHALYQFVFGAELAQLGKDGIIWIYGD